MKIKQPTKVRRQGGSIVKCEKLNDSWRRVAREREKRQRSKTRISTRPKHTSSFDPDGYAHASIKPDPQSPVADPHASIGGLSKFQTLIQTTDTLQEHQYPCDDDLIQGHGILHVGQCCQVAPERLIKEDLREPYERTQGGDEVERCKPAVRHLESGKCVKWIGSELFWRLTILTRTIC